MPSVIQHKDLIEAPASPAPPIPLHNPRRDIPRYQAAPRYHPISDDNIEAAGPPFAATSAFGELNREAGETQQSAASDGFRARRPDAKMDRRTCRIYYDPLPLSLREEDKISLASTSSSLTSGLKRYSSLLNLRGNTTSVHQDDERTRKQSEIEQAMARIQSSLDLSEALTSISSYDGAPVDWPIVEAEEDDSRIEAWLQRGVIDTPLPESDRTFQPERAQNFTTTKRKPALTISPPGTGRREYATPLSPMNNGRDAYGNYIPTNARDYITAPPTPITSAPRVTSASRIAEDQPRQRLKQISRPNLRGGGGWWNILGIEKEPLGTEPPGLPGLRGTRHSTSVPSLKSKYSMGNQDHAPSRLGGYGGDLREAGSAFGRKVSTTNGRTMAQVDDDWSDESEPVIVDISEPGRSRRTEPIADGPGYPRVRDHSKIPLPLSPRPRSPTQNFMAYKHPIDPMHNNQKSTYSGATIRTVNEYDPPVRPFAAAQTVESPRSGVTHGSRAHKKWNNGPATGPPMDTAVPPPVPPKESKPLSQVTTSLSDFSFLKTRYERTDSPVESYDGHAWELQSLQLGESVSVAGHGPRHDCREVLGMQQPSNLSPEEFKAAQLRGQVEFRPLCQDIMIRYKAELSRLDRALTLDQMSPEQYDMQMKWNTDNKDKALRYSAEQSGYVILKDESDILSALTTPDGYAIYLDMLAPTNPSLWQTLSEKHNAAQNPDKSRGSSLDQARQVAGKIARFMLAAPSDPDLKTHSTRRPSNGSFGSASSALALAGWMDPMNVAAAGGVINNEAWRTRRKKKSEEKHVYAHERIETHDFATPGPAQLTGTPAAAPPSTSSANHSSRLTGTTTVPSHTNTTYYTKPNPPPERPVRHNTRPLPERPARHDFHPPPERRATHTASTTASQISMWPEGDSQGNWHDVTRPVLRGGDGRMEKRDKKKAKKPWMSALYGEAMHFHG